MSVTLRQMVEALRAHEPTKDVVPEWLVPTTLADGWGNYGRMREAWGIDHGPITVEIPEEAAALIVIGALVCSWERPRRIEDLIAKHASDRGVPLPEVTS